MLKTRHYPKANHHQDIPTKNRQRRLRKKKGLIPGKRVPLQKTEVETFFSYKRNRYKRVEPEVTEAGIGVVILGTDFLPPVTYLPPRARVTLIAA